MYASQSNAILVAAGPLVTIANPGLPVTCVALRYMAGSLFMTNQNMSDFESRIGSTQEESLRLEDRTLPLRRTSRDFYEGLGACQFHLSSSYDDLFR